MSKRYRKAHPKPESENKIAVRPKNLAQRSYLNEIETHDLTFGIGPAGTGKTYLAVSTAVKALRSHQVEKIILVRPAVEAGEKLGYLPGSLQEKVDPYMMPLYDALTDMLDGHLDSYLQSKVIQVVPLAFMRGRTLNNAFIILDEAQNTTVEQMKMFLTRMGERSKIVVTGDLTQVDLQGRESGLAHFLNLLNDEEEISVMRFSASDVVRHPLVQKIIGLYEQK